MKNRLPVLLFLCFLIPLGLGTKFYHGPGGAWVNAYAGDIFYPMFWYFLALLLFPRAHPLRLAVTVFLFSTAVEFSQLADGALLTRLRQSFLGRTLVGVSFSRWDIFYYALGCLFAMLLHVVLYFFFLPFSAFEPQGHDDAL